MDYRLAQLRRKALLGALEETNAYAREILRATGSIQDVVDALGGPAAYDFFSKGVDVGGMLRAVSEVENVLLGTAIFEVERGEPRMPYFTFTGVGREIVRDYRLMHGEPAQFKINDLRYEAKREYGELAIRAIWDISAYYPIDINLDSIHLQLLMHPDRPLPWNRDYHLRFIHEWKEYDPETYETYEDYAEGTAFASRGETNIASALRRAWYGFVNMLTGNY